ncbi:MAG: response regulator transcription factor [Bacilli bacterium]|nr:response regulator transcription factor [Bacilli bacterium]
MNKSILTTREREIFNLLIEGYVTKEISSKLNISEKTVRNHISNVIQKLEVNTRYQAVIELVKLDELKI